MSMSISTSARTVGLRRPCSAVRTRSRLTGRRRLWVAGSGVVGLMFVCRASRPVRLGVGFDSRGWLAGWLVDKWVAVGW